MISAFNPHKEAAQTTSGIGYLRLRDWLFTCTYVLHFYCIQVDAMLQELEKEIDDVDAQIGNRWQLLDRYGASMLKVV